MELTQRLTLIILTILYLGLAILTVLVIVEPESENIWKWASVLLYVMAGSAYMILLFRNKNGGK